jgi:succinate dehydrogenase flavin-adding protein (antitoxin of CptAB toxin-antitoxin module)
MEEDIKITEEELQAIYIYLSMTYSTMSQEEKDSWYSILSKIDKDFYED